MSTQTTLSRVESFPFDSRSDGYDADGYPVYDRAVGATMLRETFKKFFTDGVFPSPGDALQISKGSGLTVTIQPGIFIIRGAMGGCLTDAHSLTLDTAAPQGNVCYGIMLRYDENEQYRSCYLRVVRGDAASSPQPPAPDQSTPGVMEYRLGYVTVPTGATDLTSATVTNEKGLAVCPYAAPFEEIDMSGVTADAKASANEALTQLLAYFESNREAIDAALSGEEATYLQQQITELQEQLADLDIDLTSEVDNLTIEYTGTDNPVDPKKLRVKSKSIGTDKIADGAITADLLAEDVVSFTDDVSSTAGASSRTAATPKMVHDLKYQASGCTLLLDEGTINGKKYLNFNTATVNGFTKAADGFIAPFDMNVVVSVAFDMNQYGQPPNLTVNGSTVATFQETSNVRGMGTIAMSVDAGDKIGLYNPSGNYSLYDVYVNVGGF